MRAWAELSDQPFAPDYEQIEAMLSDERTLFYVGDIGFYGFIINEHFFTGRRVAAVITLWIEPQSRGTFRAGRFIAGLLKAAKDMGGEEITFTVAARSPLIDSWETHFGAPSDLVFVRDL